MTEMIEQPEPLTSQGSITLGDTFTDPAIRRLFRPLATTASVATYRFAGVVLDTVSTMVLSGRTVLHCGGYRHQGDQEAAIRRLQDSPGLRLRDRCAFMAFGKFDNYFHWLTECIPAIAGYQADPDFAGGVLLLPTAANLTDSMKHALLLATGNGPLPDIYLVGRQQLVTKELVVSGFLRPRTLPSRFANSVFDRMASLVDGPKCSPRRHLYVSRADSAQRPMTNEGALTALMIQFGFEPVLPGSLSQAAQIRAFRDADVVVGAHGAGLTNIGFMRPATSVYELFPSGWVNPCFNVICQGRGLHYYADVFPCQAAAPTGFADFRALSWQVDLGVVERRLVAILASLDRREPQPPRRRAG